MDCNDGRRLTPGQESSPVKFIQSFHAYLSGSASKSYLIELVLLYFAASVSETFQPQDHVCQEAETI